METYKGARHEDGTAGGSGGGDDGGGAAARGASPAVSATNAEGRIVLDNGLVAITIDTTKNNAITSLRAKVGTEMKELGSQARAAMVFDFNGDTPEGKKLASGVGGKGTAKLAAHDDESAEVTIASGPVDVLPYDTVIHYILRRGEPGFYAYVVFHHGAGMPATVLEQTRAVIWAARGTDLFTNYIVDDQRKGPFHTGDVLATPFDTTWVRTDDHTAHSKYETSLFNYEDLVHGLAGHGVGLWVIQPGRDYVNGGPIHQELTVHPDSPQRAPQNNVLLWMLQGNHFGAPMIEIGKDEEWTRCYGPCFVYANASEAGTDALWEDAKKKAKEEDAKWPYAFVKDAAYPLERGTVSGSVTVATGDSAKGAWVVLAPAGAEDWTMSANGYEYWTKADAAGKFSIGKVRPGNYKLFVSGANQFEDFAQDGVSVAAGKTTDVGTLQWKPETHGKVLWQIGVPDRSDAEFAYGTDTHHFINYQLYPQHFPEDVSYVVGKSDPAKDWNFSQWGWYAKRPYWSVTFAGPAGAVKDGMLTIGFVAFDYPKGLKVTLNGKELQTIKLKKSGMAAYRAGGQDSLRQVVRIPVAGADLHGGENELRLEPVGGVKYDPASTVMPNQLGAVMYDALRLEVE